MNVGGCVYIRLVNYTVRSDGDPKPCFWESMYKCSGWMGSASLKRQSRGSLLDCTSSSAGSKPLPDILSEVLARKSHAMHTERRLR